MDLPELLEPERIRCHCDIHSKKRALQTVAELLGAALRETPDEAVEADGQPAAGGDEGDGGPGRAEAANGAAEETPKTRDGGRGLKLRGRGKERRDKEARGGKRGGQRGAARDEPDTAEVSDMDILDALISRERLGSTGLGHGVALPHSRLDRVSAPLAAMITLNDGVDFEAGDGEPVDLVLGLLVPRDCNDEHLKILANLARRFSDAELREELRGYDSGEALFAHLQQLDAAGGHEP